MQNNIANKQIAAKEALRLWLGAEGVTLKRFALAMDYTYPHAWSLVRGQANLSDEFVGRLLAAYGPAPAQLVSDALQGVGPAVQQKP